MKREEIEAKIDLVIQNLEVLGRIPQQTFEEFSADFRNLDSALHRLQTTIQALIDLACSASARRGLPGPGSSRDVIVNLEAAGHVPPGSTNRFGPMLSFRNRVVHLYDRIDPRIVFRILREERGDLKSLLELLVPLVAG